LTLIQELFSNLVQEIELEVKVKQLLHLTEEEIKDIWIIINPKKKEEVAIEEVKLFVGNSLGLEIHVRKWNIFEPERFTDLNPQIHKRKN